MKLLILDNYDSFTYNLVHLAKELGADTTVIRNDKMTVEEVAAFDRILLSPGPGVPSEGGIMPEVIRRYAGHRPIMGVCLGHQAIGEAFGGQLINLSDVYHGVATTIRVTEPDEPLFAGVPGTFAACRYHSWVVSNEQFPSNLQITALDDVGHVMALRHRQYDICGVQFHPESFLTEYGRNMLQNWLKS